MTGPELEARLDQIEYRQELLFEDSRVSRIYFEYNVTRQQSKEIADLFDKYRTSIDNNEQVSHHSFEQEMFDIVPQHNANYHFVEFVAQSMHESGSWEEVFEELYGGMMKFQTYMNKKDD